MENVMLEGVTLAFRNFSGRVSDYNLMGRREFSVVLPPDVAADLSNKGWNVKTRQPREEGDDVFYHLPVAVNFNSPVRPPEIIVVTQKGRSRVDEEAVGMLDYAEITNCDVYLNPSQWTVGDKTGIKAYLTSMYVTILLDPLALKYADVPEMNQTPSEG